MKLKVNGKRVDLSKALPLTLGDLLELEKEQGGFVDGEGNLRMATLSDTAKMLGFVLRKADDQITEEDVRSITLPDIARFNDYFAKANAIEVPEAERPTSPP